MLAEPLTGPARYLPGLDGIRAIGVVAIVAYQLHAPLAPGGLLAGSVFFSLSGYLTSSSLVQELEGRSSIDLQAFWRRRARRLLPASLLLLAVVLLASAVARPTSFAKTLWPALAALIGGANWAAIAGSDGFRRLSGPEPLDHLWSVSVVAQFYVLWPPLVLALLWLGRRLAPGRTRLLLTVATALLAVASTWALGSLFHPQDMNDIRAYAGTDTRSAAFLVGALAALALPVARVVNLSGHRRLALEVAGALALGGVLWGMALTDEGSPSLYRGGELAMSVATATLAVAAAHPATVVARMLGWVPLRWLGARAYGIYLWYLPVVAFLPDHVLARSPVLRGSLALGLVVTLAAASYRFVEIPFRRALPAQPGATRSRRWVPVLGVGLGATAALALWPFVFPRPRVLDRFATEPLPIGTWPTTSCREVVHVGDSTSVGLIAPMSIPNADEQIAARYRAVGVTRFQPEIVFSRSIVEHFQDQLNATDLVKRIRAGGYRGCWVLALGTNDPATVDGDAEELSRRIDQVMKQIDGAPALWTTTRTLRDQGSYRNANMASWNQALRAACPRHPNMRVYDWAGEVQDDWFAADAVHFNTLGYRQRALRLAKALAHAFPQNEPPSAACLVDGAD